MSDPTPPAAHSNTLQSSPGLAPPPKEPALGTTPAETNYGDVVLGEKDATRLADFLRDELTRANAYTLPFRDKLIELRQFMDPPKFSSDEPWAGAANYFMPIGRIVVDALKSTTKQSVERRQRKLFVTEIISYVDAGLAEGQTHDAELGFVELAEKIAREPGYADFPTMFDIWMEEMFLTGIGVVKKVSTTESQRVIRLLGRNERGEPIVPDAAETVVRHLGSRYEIVPTDTFLWPPGPWTSMEQMLWKGNKVFLTPAMLRMRAGGDWKYINVEETIATGLETLIADPSQLQRADAVAQPGGVQGTWISDIDLAWDLFGNGVLHALQVTYSLAANKILRILYSDGSERYDFEVMSPRSGAVFGRGALEHITQLIAAINKSINQTFNAQSLANAPSIITGEDTTAAAKMALGYYLGMHLPAQDGERIDVLKFPEPTALSYQMIGLLQGYIEKLTRIGPSQLGDVSEGRRTPATLGLATQQMGAQQIDEMIDRLRLTAGRMMSALILDYYQQTQGKIVRDVLGEKQAAAVTAVIEHSLKERKSLHQLIRLRLTASSGTRSIELERQNALATEQMAMTWSSQIINLLMLLFSPQSAVLPPEAKEVVMRLMKAREEGMRRLVELASQADPTTVVPEITDILLPAIQQLNVQQAQQAQMMTMIAAAGGGMGGAGGGMPGMGGTPGGGSGGQAGSPAR